MIVRKQIICVDEDGNPLGPPEDIPEPQSVPNGLSAIPSYASRLLSSSASFSSLMVSTADGARGCGLARRGREIQIFFPIDWHRHPEEERCLREFFTRHGIAPAHDYLAQNGGVPGSTRILMYPLPDSSEGVASLCSGLLVSCFGISGEDTLQFTLQDR